MAWFEMKFQTLKCQLTLISMGAAAVASSFTSAYFLGLPLFFGCSVLPSAFRLNTIVLCFEQRQKTKKNFK
jgi:hypothetical protein